MYPPGTAGHLVFSIIENNPEIEDMVSLYVLKIFSTFNLPASSFWKKNEMYVKAVFPYLVIVSVVR